MTYNRTTGFAQMVTLQTHAAVSYWDWLTKLGRRSFVFLEDQVKPPVLKLVIDVLSELKAP